MNRVSRVIASLGASALVALTAPTALAHDSVVGGSITTGEVVESFPEKIMLEFSGIPKDGFNTFAVTNVDTGEVLFDAEPSIDGRKLTVDVPDGIEAGPGKYQVGFQITSSDGHATRGSVPFSVAGDSAGQGSADVATQPIDADSASSSEPVGKDGLQGIPTWAKLVVALGAILAAGAVLIMALGRARR